MAMARRPPRTRTGSGSSRSRTPSSDQELPQAGPPTGRRAAAGPHRPLRLRTPGLDHGRPEPPDPDHGRRPRLLRLGLGHRCSRLQYRAIRARTPLLPPPVLTGDSRRPRLLRHWLSPLPVPVLASWVVASWYMRRPSSAMMRTRCSTAEPSITSTQSQMFCISLSLLRKKQYLKKQITCFLVVKH